MYKQIPIFRLSFSNSRVKTLELLNWNYFIFVSVLWTTQLSYFRSSAINNVRSVFFISSAPEINLVRPFRNFKLCNLKSLAVR